MKKYKLSIKRVKIGDTRVIDASLKALATHFKNLDGVVKDIEILCNREHIIKGKRVVITFKELFNQDRDEVLEYIREIEKLLNEYCNVDDINLQQKMLEQIMFKLTFLNTMFDNFLKRVRDYQKELEVTYNTKNVLINAQRKINKLREEIGKVTKYIKIK